MLIAFVVRRRISTRYTTNHVSLKNFVHARQPKLHSSDQMLVSACMTE